MTYPLNQKQTGSQQKEPRVWSRTWFN